MDLVNNPIFSRQCLRQDPPKVGLPSLDRCPSRSDSRPGPLPPSNRVRPSTSPFLRRCRRNRSSDPFTDFSLSTVFTCTRTLVVHKNNIHTHISHVPTYIYTQMYTRTCTYTHTRTYNKHIHTHNTYTQSQISVCTPKCTYMYVLVYTNTHTC